MPALRRLSALVRSWPVETFAVVLVPGMFAVAIVVATPGALDAARAVGVHFVALQFFFAGSFFALFLMAVYAYLALRFVVELIRFAIAPDRTARKAVTRSAGSLAASGLYLVFLLGGGAIVSFLLLGPLSMTDPARIRAASDRMMAWDHALFGVYPPLWLAHLRAGWIAWILVHAYHLLTRMTSMWMFVLLFASTRLFRRFVLSFFLASTLAVPLWYLFPGGSPQDVYWDDVLGGETPAEIQASTPDRADVAPILARYLESMRGYWSDPARGRFGVTSFPSMHAAWGAIIVYFAFLLWWPLGLVLAPWGLTNLVATVYTQQHYAVDPMAGLLLAAVAIALAHALVRWDERRPTAGRRLFAVADTAQADVRRLLGRPGRPAAAPGPTPPSPPGAAPRAGRFGP